MKKKITRKAAIAQIVSVAPQVPAPSALDIRVGIDDVKSMATARLRSILMTARTEAKRVLEEANDALATASRAAKTATVRVIDEEARRVAAPVIEAIQAWTGKSDVKVASTDEEDDKKPLSFTVKDSKLEFTVRVVNKTSSYYWDNYLSREVEIEMPPELATLRQEEAEAAEASKIAQRALSDVNHAIANIPNMAEIVRSQLTMAKLTDTLQTNDDVIRVVQDAINGPEIRGMLPVIAQQQFLLAN